MLHWRFWPLLSLAAVTLAVAWPLLASPAGAQQILPDRVQSVMDRLAGGEGAETLSESDRALLFKHNDDINAAAFNGDINDTAYQAAQNDYAALNREFAADAAADAHADFTVQQRKTDTFSPGTDSDYITVVVDSVEEIEQMQSGYNARINAYLAEHELLDEPRSDWHNKLDTDFMADPRYVTEAQFREIARLNNDAYTRRHSAEFEKLIRDPSKPPIDPFHIVAYTQEMDDFAKKKGRSIDSKMGSAEFGQPRGRADVFRTMALQQKYISRIEMAENIWRQQHGLPPRDYSNSPAVAGSLRTHSNHQVIQNAHRVADQTLAQALSNMAETMAEVQKIDPNYSEEQAGADIATLLGRMPADLRSAVLDRLSGIASPNVTVAAVFNNAVLTRPALPATGPSPESPPLALPAAPGYAGAYVQSATRLADDQKLLPASAEERFVLPDLQDASRKAGDRRAPLWDRLSQEATRLLGPLNEGEEKDLGQIIKRQKELEQRAMRAAYGEFIGALPAGAQNRLRQVESFYDAHSGSIDELSNLFQQANFVATIAGSYYRKGAAGVFEAALKIGCNRLFKSTTDLASAALSTEFGAAGYYVSQAAGSVLRTEICGRFIPALFKEGVGESWLDGRIVYASDPVVNEWVKIFYTGEIMAGVDRPELPSGLDFFFRERVRDKRDIAKKFPSQPELHKALQNHWRSLRDAYPQLSEYLDLTNSETARAIWKRIYKVAGESLVEVLRERLDAQPKPQTDSASILEYFSTGAIEWPPPGARPSLRAISADPKDLGVLELGTIQDVSAKLGVVGLAGIDEQLTFRWRVEGPDMVMESDDDQESISLEFPEEDIHPIDDLFKVVTSTFDLDLSPDVFQAGEAYEVIATVDGTDEILRFPFTVSGAEDACGPDAGACPPEGGEEAHFVISVEGHGFAPAFDFNAKPRTVDADGTVWIGQSGAYVGYEVSGKSQVWMTLKAGEDHDRAKESFRHYLLSRACRANSDIWDNPARSAGLPDHSAPTVWQQGPKIVTVAGPFATRQEHGEDLPSDWQQIRQTQPDGSHVFMNELIEKVQPLDDCDGSCCSIQCTDPFHCG